LGLIPRSPNPRNSSQDEGMTTTSTESNSVNDRALKTLSRAIAHSQGHFSLILVRSNYQVLTAEIVERLQDSGSAPLPEFQLPPSVKTLYTAIQDRLQQEQPQGLLVFGLESIDAVEKILNPTNQVREEFRQNFTFPLVLWVNDLILQKLTRFAPDFKSWAAIPIKFELGTEGLLEALQQTVDVVLPTLLEVGAGKFIERERIALPAGCLRLAELEMAFRELQQHSQPQEASLDANLHFLMGREADASGEKENAKQCYELSRQRWQEVIDNNPSPTHWTHYGCLLFYLGLWWRQYATLHRHEYAEACRQAKDHYQHCLEALQQAEHPDLEQKFINAMGEVLTRLGAWQELNAVARKAVPLHQTYGDSVRLAHSYGFLAEVALAQGQPEEAQKYAQEALQLNEAAPDSGLDWSWHQAYHRNYYRLLLARSQQDLRQIPEAVENLELARRESLPEHDPPLYIRILESLRSLKFDAGEYLEAFEIKQEKQSIEQQYGLRAFVGAGRLQVRRQVAHLALPHREGQLNVTAEIAASGRLQDIQRLIRRMGRTDCKLTIIHGQSGVGKSSLVQAGLVPALREKVIEARDVLPVLVQSYGKWEKTIGAAFPRGCEHLPKTSLPILEDAEAIVDQLRQGSDRDWLTVLIFDQFEEFFFAHKDPQDRKPFFQFLGECLNIPYVKVILSLREDYLHYLLECNRLVDLGIINNNILDKNILYYLGNLAPDDARSVIQTLTTDSQFYLDGDLMDALVADLARDLGEVRPIELQIVGAQLQTDNITTLAQFNQYGSKEALVERFLDEIVQDCGPNNTNLVKIILYLLTDENNTRPLKTRAELKNEVELTEERMDSILSILVRSGLAFQVPGFPDERYQLVHDYLVPFIRQKQSQQLIAELEKEREQRRLTEAKLNQALQKNLRTARRATATLAGLLFAITGIASIATVAGINLYISGLISKSSSKHNKELDRLVSAIETGKILKKVPFVMPGLRLKAKIELNHAILNLNEINRLEGHRSAVTKVVFSPDGQLIASADKRNEIKIWDITGHHIADLVGHSDKIAGISFNYDNRFVASVSEDNILKVWDIEAEKEEKEVQLPPIAKPVTSVSFSPDKNIIAFASGQTIERLNILTRKFLPQLKGHKNEITNIAFSRDGTMLASSDLNDEVKIWHLYSGEKLATLSSYGTIHINFNEDGSQLTLVSKDSSIKHYLLENRLSSVTLLKTIEADLRRNPNIKVSSWNSPILAFVNRHNSKTINLKLVDVDDLPYSTELEGHRDRINDLSFNSNRKILASASEDRTIKIWDMKKHFAILSRNGSNEVNKVKFNKKGDRVITTHSKNRIRFMDKYGENESFIPFIPANNSLIELTLDGQKILTETSRDEIQIHPTKNKGESIAQNENGLAKIAISPDGKRIVAIGYDNVVKFLDTNGQVLKSKEYPELDTRLSWLRSRYGIQALFYTYKSRDTVLFSPDSQRITLITKHEDDRKNTIYLFSRDGQRLKKIDSHINEVTKIKFSPDSQMFATIGDDNFIYIYDKNGEEINLLKEHENQITDVSFSYDSTMLVSSSRNSTGRSEIKLWNVNNLSNPIKVWKSYATKNIEFSPDNKTISTWNYDNTIQIWNLQGDEIKLIDHEGEVTDIDFSPYGEILASASADNFVRLWYKDGTEPKVLRGHSETVRQVVFSPTSQTFVSVSIDGMVNLWRRDGSFRKTLQSPSKIEDKENSYRRDRIQFSKDGKIITLVSKIIERDRSTSTIQWWDDKGKKIDPVDERSSWDFDKTSFSPESGTMAIIHPIHDLNLWDLDGNKLQNFSGHTDKINSVSFSQDEKILASASDDKTVKLWLLNGKLNDNFFKTLPHKDKVNAVSFSPDSQILVSGSDDNTVQVWDREGNWLETLEHKDRVNSVQFSDKGRFLASASGKLVRVWQKKRVPKENGELFQEYPYPKPLIHDDIVTDLYFSDDGKYLVSMAKDNSVKLWRVSDGELREQFNNVRAVTFSPDSKLLVTEDKILMLDSLWFKEEIDLSTPYSWNSVQFNPDDEKTIAIGHRNGLSILYLDLDKLLTKACNLGNDYLNKKKYRHLCDGVTEE